MTRFFGEACGFALARALLGFMLETRAPATVRTKYVHEVAESVTVL
jgi:hypothetical protein